MDKENFLQLPDDIKYLFVSDILYKQYLNDMLLTNILINIFMLLNCLASVVLSAKFDNALLSLYIAIVNTCLLIILIIYDKVVNYRYEKRKQQLRSLYGINLTEE